MREIATLRLRAVRNDNTRAMREITPLHCVTLAMNTFCHYEEQQFIRCDVVISVFTLLLFRHSAEIATATRLPRNDNVSARLPRKTLFACNDNMCAKIAPATKLPRNDNMRAEIATATKLRHISATMDYHRPRLPVITARNDNMLDRFKMTSYDEKIMQLFTI